MRFSGPSILHKSISFASMSEAKAAVSISPLLLRLADPTTTLFSVTADEVALAVSHIFANAISPVQTGCLLYALHTTQLDRRPDILAACASSMRYAAAQVDHDALAKAVSQRARKEGQYHGGLVRYAQAILIPCSSTDLSTV
jgi:anthranilate phosphoribosyltransferase